MFPQFLEATQAREGRTCPRVELEPDNVLAANLLSLTVSDHASLAPAWWEAMGADPDVEERRAVLRRVVLALNHEELTERLRKPPDAERPM